MANTTITGCFYSSCMWCLYFLWVIVIMVKTMYMYVLSVFKMLINSYIANKFKNHTHLLKYFPLLALYVYI